MTNSVLLVCGEVSDLLMLALAQRMEERIMPLYIVRLGNEYAYEGVASREAMFDEYGEDADSEDNALAMLVRQGELMNNVLTESVGEDHEVLAVAFDVPKSRNNDNWNWVDSFFADDGVPYWWLETASDGVQVLVSDHEPAYVLRALGT